MKKNMIKILTIILSINMLMTGCAKEENASKENNTSKESKLKGEITFSTWGSLEEKKVNEEIIKLFEAKNPGTKVKLEYIPDEYTTKVETMFLGKNPPDVIYGHPKYFTKWASQGLLMDLTDRFKKDPELLDDTVFNTKLYDSFKYEGNNIATINGADTLVLYYNKDLFDKAGVKYPNDSWTWNDLIEASKRLTTFENGKPTQFGISIDEGYSLMESFVFGHGGELYDDMNNPKVVKFKSEETIQGLQLMKDLIHKYKVAPSNSDKEVLGGGFDNGKIAMNIDGVWSIVYRTNIQDFKWDIANIPLVEGKERRIPALYAGYALAKSTKNPELAWEFARFMQSDEAQKLLASSGLITVINKKIATSDEVIKIQGAPENHMLRVTSLDDAIHNDVVLVNWQESISKVITPNMQLLLDNKQNAKTTADKIQDGLEKMLKEEKK